MARRSKVSGDAVNLDSLMDALTNVVAVLILVLILVQTEVTQKVAEFFENLEPATPEQVEAAQEKLEELREQEEQRRDLLKEDPPTPQQIEEEKRKLALLEKNVKLDETLLIELEKLRKLEKEAREKRDVELKETNILQEEIAKLEARIDTTPDLSAAPPTVVTIPNSRPIPSNAKVYYAIVRGNRVHFIDPHTPAEMFYDELKDNRRELYLERIKAKGADIQVYNHQKTRDHFKDFDFKNGRDQKVVITSIPTHKYLALDIIPDLKNGGTSLEELEAPDNRFIGILKTLRNDRKNVLFFRVHPDSFNTYLVARALADKAGVPAGWEVHTNPMFRHMLTEVEVNRLKKPDPPDPNAPKPPARPPRIGPKLD
ncbi:MAG: hypothetical protein HKN82_05790 [Akkermansiaceae bacterium]|nr:hypothetical protein [Akkermansiaceae bacterium]